MTITEIDEITQGKTAKEIENEIAFQLRMGETPGGTIISLLEEALYKLQSAK